ncbi:chorismate lyase [Undibacterium sp. LX15W]|uniref:Probable chorismate pyruvate-lyase n=2 Tax=Undibacterium flavidum TaxID=2762297 RepID=A0ABR6YE66_9BURK|nr:chorismate lyase [Undibacterium flavidum]
MLSDHPKQLHRPAFAQWHQHINGVQTTPFMADWLSNRASLTARLIAHSQQFRVERLYQGRAMCLQDEFAEIDLAKPQQVIEREVLLRCDDVAVVYAHTVVPLSATAHEWPLFASLGNRSLGTTLFNDPMVQRGELQYARLSWTHPLMRRIAACGLIKSTSPASRYLLARRSVFKRHGAKLLVTEVFLPTIHDLRLMTRSDFIVSR